MMKTKYVIKVVLSVVLGVFAFFVVMLCLAMVLKNMKKDSIDTKEELIDFFNENCELFYNARESMENNDYKFRITRDKTRRGDDKNYIIFYEDVQSSEITDLFNNSDWKIDTIDKNEEDKSTDACTVFTEINGKPMSNYWGVYYVEDDFPIGWNGEKRFKPTERQGDGYYLEEYGCRYYTERISENWWYFEALY